MDLLEDQVKGRDVALGAAIAVVLGIEAWSEHASPLAATLVFFALLAVLVVVRRRAPQAAVIAAFAGQLIAVSIGVSITAPVAPLVVYAVLLYTLALHERLRPALVGLVAAFVLTLAALVVAHVKGGRFDWTDIPFVALVVGGPWLLGRTVQGRVRESEVLEERAERLELERLTAVADERARIARELHDVIAHSVSVMVVQAAAAEEVLKRDPSRAVDPIRSVQETGRQALVEMSRLVGLLREGSDEIGLAPQPRLHELPALIGQVREAGLPVELSVEGDERPLSLGIELTAYRVVQEALTNALKHAGETHADVRLRYGPDALELEVADDGAGTDEGHAGGHGLPGMRERVNVFGGDFAAGPRPEGGFAVRVRLPLAAETR